MKYNAKNKSPRFLNTLKKEMSLVGTISSTVDEQNKYIPYYRSRLSIKPGITGVWQASERPKITVFNETVNLNNEYINDWTISLNFKILFKDIWLFLNDESGAL